MGNAAFPQSCISIRDLILGVCFICLNNNHFNFRLSSHISCHNLPKKPLLKREILRKRFVLFFLQVCQQFSSILFQVKNVQVNPRCTFSIGQAQAMFKRFLTIQLPADVSTVFILYFNPHFRQNYGNK